MRLLFSIDKHDYDPNGEAFRRPSARGIILREGKLSMIYSRARGYYKLPGGGIEPGEDIAAAMMREVHEETGLTVLPESVREYGYVHRIQKGKHEPVFIQDNFYFLCEVTGSADAVTLTAEEQAEDFVPVFVTPQEAIAANETAQLEDAAAVMVERENRVLRLLMEEGIV